MIMKLTNYNAPKNRESNVEDWFLSPFAGFPALTRYLDPGYFSGHKPLVAEVHEDAENFYANFEVPGVKKENVKLDLNNRMLTVNVDKKIRQGQSESSYTLTRSISLPDSVNTDKISARLEDGILVVTLPKAEESKPRTIEVA